MQVLSAFDHLYEIIGLAAVVLACGLAFAGRIQERLAAGLLLLDVFSIALLAWVIPLDPRLPVMELKAMLILAGYAAMTVRYSDRWIIALCGLQGFAVLLHLSHLLDVSIPRSVNGLMLNLTGWAMIITLVGAALARLVQPRSIPWEGRIPPTDQADSTVQREG